MPGKVEGARAGKVEPELRASSGIQAEDVKRFVKAALA
jgi:hypothetical protein